MICPWLVKTITETDNKNSFNSSRRVEHQEFDKCMKQECPFYYGPECAEYSTHWCSTPACLRAVPQPK